MQEGRGSRQEGRHFIVGGGIAGLATAAFLIRDAGVPGESILVFEKEGRAGGSLDGAGSPHQGYMVRGGRMLEEHFVCTFDLLASIPSTDHQGSTLKEEIEQFNREIVSFSRCRLVCRGKQIEAPFFELGARDLLGIVRLLMRSERSLTGRRIDECFEPRFFATAFWLMWSTTFAFQTWHSAAELRRYFRRFMHLLPGFKRLQGILRTRFNQYDAMVEPIVKWLQAMGVRLETSADVVDAEIVFDGGGSHVAALVLSHQGMDVRLPVSQRDRVYFTLGSMTEGAVFGTGELPPAAPPVDGAAGALWRRLAGRGPGFGRPQTFLDQIEQTRWMSFTVTLRDPSFFDFMEHFTGNAAGTGGLITFRESSWLMSIVLFHQPHFRNQPGDIFVFWGYGLHPGRSGDFTGKPMLACGGVDILRELAGHLGLGDKANSLLGGAKAIPCLMPFITSQFMPRHEHDRGQVIPSGARNYAIIGQFCEQPDDIVFTVEYSVRSSMAAVHALAGGGRRLRSAGRIAIRASCSAPHWR
jgi:oleate hydratase